VAGAPKPAKVKVVQAAVAEAKARQKSAQAAKKVAGKAGGAKMPVSQKHAGKGRT
jgi:ribosomal protein L4